MARKPAPRTKTAATVNVIDGAKMTVAGRKSVALWLRRRASDLERNGAMYAPRCRSRYVYTF